MKNSEGIKLALETGHFSNVIEQFILYKQELGFKYGKGIQTVLKQLNHQLNQFKVNPPFDERYGDAFIGTAKVGGVDHTK